MKSKRKDVHWKRKRCSLEEVKEKRCPLPVRHGELQPEIAKRCVTVAERRWNMQFECWVARVFGQCTCRLAKCGVLQQKRVWEGARVGGVRGLCGLCSAVRHWDLELHIARGPVTISSRWPFDVKSLIAKRLLAVSCWLVEISIQKWTESSELKRK